MPRRRGRDASGGEPARDPARHGEDAEGFESDLTRRDRPGLSHRPRAVLPERGDTVRDQPDVSSARPIVVEAADESVGSGLPVERTSGRVASFEVEEPTLREDPSHPPGHESHATLVRNEGDLARNEGDREPNPFLVSADAEPDAGAGDRIPELMEEELTHLDVRVALGLPVEPERSPLVSSVPDTPALHARSADRAGEVLAEMLDASGNANANASGAASGKSEETGAIHASSQSKPKRRALARKASEVFVVRLARAQRQVFLSSRELIWLGTVILAGLAIWALRPEDPSVYQPSWAEPHPFSIDGGLADRRADPRAAGGIPSRSLDASSGLSKPEHEGLSPKMDPSQDGEAAVHSSAKDSVLGTGVGRRGEHVPLGDGQGEAALEPRIWPVVPSPSQVTVRDAQTAGRDSQATARDSQGTASRREDGRRSAEGARAPAPGDRATNDRGRGESFDRDGNVTHGSGDGSRNSGEETSAEGKEPLRRMTSTTAVGLVLVSVLSDPPGASVRIDGVMVGKTPLVTRAAPGQAALEVRITRSGHRPWLSVVRPDGRGQFTVNAKLERR